MSIRIEPFGTTGEGDGVEQATLDGGAGVVAKIITYGGRITSIVVPDRDGQPADIALGFDSLEPYLKDRGYFGATVGRYANRIGGGRFTLDGREYVLSANEGPNTLHGGKRGFDKVLWSATPVSEAGAEVLRLTHTNPHMDQGFPGELRVAVTYRMKGKSLRIDYEATADRTTPVNLTHHPYMNLRGAGQGTILDHRLMIAADEYTPADKALIPMGQIVSVRGTGLDFTTAKPIGQDIGKEGAGAEKGYDHNFVLRPANGQVRLAARLEEPTSGRILEVLTDQPGMQFYSGNYLKGSIHGRGGAYERHGSVSLETQHYPDSMHHAHFPTTILRPGEVFHSTTIWRFTAQ